MSQTDDTDHKSREEVSTIKESLERAQAAMNRYDHAARSAAVGSGRPDSGAETQALVTWQSATMDAWSRLRPYLIEELEDEWWTETPMQQLDGGLKQLQRFEQPAIKRIATERVRNQGTIEHEVMEPNLMPPGLLRAATQALRHAAYDLGIAMDVDSGIRQWEFEEVKQDGEVS